MSIQPANRRTWHEDGLVLGVLLGVVLGGMALIGPAERAAITVPAPINIAATDTGDSRYLPYFTPAPTPAIPEPVIDPRQLPLPADQLIPSATAFITLFGEEKPPQMWHRARHDNDRHFLTDFREANVLGAAEGLSLSVTEKPESSPRPWTGGEISSNGTYGYGRYETMMKPAIGSGLVSGFFTYTGPYFGNDHDEIDFEFLGQNPRQVELNMWRKGVPYAGKIIDLSYDATADFHLYAFEWRPDEVVWYIDGELVHRASLEDYPIPVTPGKIYLNMWTGLLYSWHGPARFESGAAVEYTCVSFRPIGSNARKCSDFYAPPSNGSPVAATE